MVGGCGDGGWWVVVVMVGGGWWVGVVMVGGGWVW